MKKMSPNNIQIIKEKSCGIILFDDQDGESKFLLLHYPSGHWDFPKGHVEEFDANELATAKRELMEETGIEDIQVFEDFKDAMHYSFQRGSRQVVEKTVVYFVAKSLQADVAISHEHQDFIWLPYKDAFNRLTFENAKDLLEKAHNFLNQS